MLVDAEGSNNMTDGTTYGFFDGAPSGQFVVCKGVGNVAGEGKHNFIWLTSMTNKPLNLVKGRVVTTFTRDDLDAYDTIQAEDDSNTNELTRVRKITIAKMSDAELDGAIANTEHLRTLDLSSAASMFTAPGLRRLKEMSFLNGRLWDESEKPPPPSGAKCTILLSKEPTLHGHMPHVNPTVRSQLTDIINGKLQLGIIEPGNGPYSSTVLLLPKPKGGIRFVLDYRVLNENVVTDAYTLPRVEKVLSALSGGKIFSTYVPYCPVHSGGRRAPQLRPNFAAAPTGPSRARAPRAPCNLVEHRAAARTMKRGQGVLGQTRAHHDRRVPASSTGTRHFRADTSSSKFLLGKSYTYLSEG